jgi:hypothetical protein
MVYCIVKQSGGYIWAYSEPGLGTTFKLYFRRSQMPSLSRLPPLQKRRFTHRGALSLVAEDDALVRGMIRRSLTEAGFTVIEAANGQEALEKQQA